MKKVLFFLILSLPFVVMAQAQPLSSNLGIQSHQTYDVPSGNRSIPPGNLVWSQLPYCENAYASQLDEVYPLDARCADDFMFTTDPGPITAVRWWNLWFNPSEYSAPVSFNIYVYNDLECYPESVIASWNIPFADAHEDAGCSQGFVSREYWAFLNPSFTPVAGQNYWIVIQPVMYFPPQIGWAQAVDQNLCFAYQRFPEIGVIDWTSLQVDLAFELYSGEGQVIPLSSWVFLLAGLLIAGAVFFRYRRLS